MTRSCGTSAPADRSATRSRHSWVAAVAWLVVAAGGCGISDEPDRTPSHLVWISLDTVRADHIGSLGNRWIQTPHLDDFARQAILFEDYMNVASSTLASHVSLFSGRYPHDHGVPGVGWRIDEENVLLAEVLRDEGFHTAGFPAALALHGLFGFDQGFDHYDDRRRREVGLPPLPNLGAEGVQRSAGEITDAVTSYVEQFGGKRLFVFAHYFDAHRAAEDAWGNDYTTRAPEEYLERYRAGAMSEEARSARDRYYESLGREPTPEEREHARTYSAQITYVDEEVGRLLRNLEGLGILDRSIVVVTSDHGETLWDHDPFFNHVAHSYQAVIRGVAMIRLPGGLRGGRVVRETVSSIDLMPTLLSLFSIDVPPAVDGISLPLLDSEAEMPRVTRFSEATGYASYTQTETRAGDPWPNRLNQRTVRAGRYAYLYSEFDDREELYDVTKDPQQLENLLAPGSAQLEEHRRVAHRMRRELQEWTRPARYPSINLQKTDGEILDQLRALGYAH